MYPGNSYRLNPLSLPPETDSRFLMLIVGALAIILSALVVFIHDIGLMDWYSQGFDFASRIFLPGSLTPASNAVSSAAKLLLPQIVILGINFFLIIACFTIALIIYLRHPHRILNRYNLKPLTEADDPSFFAQVTKCCDQAGVKHDLKIELQNNTSLPVAQVFGIRGRYHLRLGYRMKLLLARKPGEFKARIFHELAHISNGDVERTYWAQAIWLPVVVTILLIALFHIWVLYNDFVILATRQGFSRSWFVNLVLSLLTLSIQAVILIVLVRFLRTSVLRVREIYADTQAAIWGARDQLERIFRQNQANVQESKTWRTFWRAHPSAAERLECIRRPEKLFEIKPDLPFMVGVLVALLALGGRPLAIYVSNFLEFMPPIVIFALVYNSGDHAWSTDTLMNWLDALVVAADISKFLLLGGAMFMIGSITTRTMGLQIERNAVISLRADRKFQRHYLSVLTFPAFLFTIGIQLGFIAIPLSTRTATSWGFGYPGWIQDYILFAADILLGYFPIAFILFWIWMSVVHILTVQVVGSHSSKAPPKKKLALINYWMGASMGLLLFAAILGQQSFLQDDYPTSILTGIVGVAFGMCCLALVFAGLFSILDSKHGDYRCPNCQIDTNRRSAVSLICPNCMAPLALWMYTKSG